MPDKRDEGGKPGLARAKLAHAYRQAMGTPLDGPGPYREATPAELLAHVLEWSHPVDALHAVHEDGAALTRALMVDAEGEHLELACAIARAWDRLEVVTELLDRADWTMCGHAR